MASDRDEISIYDATTTATTATATTATVGILIIATTEETITSQPPVSFSHPHELFFEQLSLV